MTDRELLELAAKAAGINLGAWNGELGAFMHRDADPGAGYWNPLADDRDALRLAVKLRLKIWHTDGGVYADHEVLAEEFSPCRDDAREDRAAATRRAIVRAAAEIGKAMK